MIEFVDYLVQFVMTAVCCVWAGMSFARSRKQPVFLLACFYGTFAMATLYWTLHMLLLKQTPQIFYVSDLGWVASFLFLLAVQFSLADAGERRDKTRLVWLVPFICVPQFLLYITHGDVLFNVLMCGTTFLAAWFSVKGLVYSRKEQQKKRMRFHITVLVFVALEYSLWTWSCFWVSDTLWNPYFWCDFLLSAVLAAFLPAVRKAVE